MRFRADDNSFDLLSSAKIFFKLVDKEVIPISVYEWSAWIISLKGGWPIQLWRDTDVQACSNSPRASYFVSTLFIGSNLGLPGQEPKPFETMVCYGTNDPSEHTFYWATYQEAEIAHRAIVSAILGTSDDWKQHPAGLWMHAEMQGVFEGMNHAETK